MITSLTNLIADIFCLLYLNILQLITKMIGLGKVVSSFLGLALGLARVCIKIRKTLSELRALLAIA